MMNTVWSVVARLAPLLATGSPAPADTLAAPAAVIAPAPMRLRVVDWDAMRSAPAKADLDTARTRGRARAVEYSGFYRARLKLHRALSYTMIPLFIGSYVTGDQMLKHRNDPPKWAKDLHKPFALATGVVFTVNTITGVWNLYDSRHNDAGKVKRTLHSLLFIAAGAGFTYTGTSVAKSARNREDPTHYHRTVALASMGVSVVSWGMMVFFK